MRRRLGSHLFAEIDASGSARWRMRAAGTSSPADGATIAGVIDAYLARLGIEREPPSADALRRLHQAHVERVPYETVWIHIGERHDVSPEQALARIAGSTRGGYCYHLNGAFSELLRALGYDVVRHVGGVHGPDGPAADAMTNHLVLTVHGLPSDDNPSGDWYVDVGLGDAIHDPLPLAAGVYTQPPFTIELAHTPGGVGDWHLTHDPRGSFPGMAWRAAPTDIAAFASRNVELSTSPESGFVKILSVQRRDRMHADVLRGLFLLRVDGATEQRVLGSKRELADALGDVFGFDVPDFPGDALDALWRRTSAAHEAFVNE
jgi:arylamine N-acetyltransferase